MYLLNMIPSKIILKTPFKLWTNKTPQYKTPTYLGCYNPHERILDARIINKYFIGYLKKSNKYIFYCCNNGMRIAQTNYMRIIQKINTRFIKNDEI